MAPKSMQFSVGLFLRVLHDICPALVPSKNSFETIDTMKITIGSDHAGFALKKVLLEHLKKNGHQLTDVGTDSTAPVDYPDYAEAVARGVLQGGSERGILICGSGG